jgi:chlorobactene glucosyltransferase
VDTLLGYQLGILVMLLWLFANAVTGLRALVRLSAYRGRRRATRPQVSVLVPARNAARTITACLDSLLIQDYPNFEVLVLDDNSEDRTGLIVAAIAEHDLRLRRVHPQSRPAGWLDRPWLCHQLAQEAAGDYLLFTEPSTVFHPDTLAAAVEAVERHGGDLLSAWPRQTVNTLGERVVFPLHRFLVFSFLPIRFIAGRPEASFAAVNGQFSLFRRASYQLAGGHEVVRRDPAGDVSLARRIQQRGGRLVLLDGTDLVQVTTARGTGELWRDLALNLFAAVHYSLPGLLAALTLFAILFIAPFGFLLGAVVTGQFSPAWLWLPLYQVAVVVATWALLAQRFAFPLVDAALHPLAILIFDAIVIGTVWEQFARAGLGQAGSRGPAGPEGGATFPKAQKLSGRWRVRQRDD